MFHPKASFSALAAFSSSADVEAATIAVSRPIRAATAPVVLTAVGKAAANGAAANLGTIACGASMVGSTTPDNLRIVWLIGLADSGFFSCQNGLTYCSITPDCPCKATFSAMPARPTAVSPRPCNTAIF